MPIEQVQILESEHRYNHINIHKKALPLLDGFWRALLLLVKASMSNFTTSGYPLDETLPFWMVGGTFADNYKVRHQ